MMARTGGAGKYSQMIEMTDETVAANMRWHDRAVTGDKNGARRRGMWVASK
jgi:hypothetical protein